MPPSIAAAAAQCMTATVPRSCSRTRSSGRWIAKSSWRRPRTARRATACCCRFLGSAKLRSSALCSCRVDVQSFLDFRNSKEITTSFRAGIAGTHPFTAPEVAVASRMYTRKCSNRAAIKRLEKASVNPTGNALSQIYSFALGQISAFGSSLNGMQPHGCGRLGRPAGPIASFIRNLPHGACPTAATRGVRRSRGQKD